MSTIGHDSSITIVYPAGPAVYTIKASTLPYVALTWTSEDSIVAAGHDCQPVLFQGSENGWAAAGSLDDVSAAKAGASRLGNTPVGRLNSAAFNTFRNFDSRGQGASADGASSNESELMTVHQNTITSVRPYEGAPEHITKVSTSGLDGKLVIWNVSAVGGLAGRMGGLHM